MVIIARELTVAFHSLFTTRKYKLILISLVLIAAFISVSELAVAKLFTGIILNEDKMSETKLIIFVIGFFLFFGATRAGHFLQRIYRVNVFEKPFKASNSDVKGSRDNWRWSLAFELTSLLSAFTQLFVIIVFFTYLNWGFGLLNILMVACIFQIYGRLFKGQIEAQRGFVQALDNRVKTMNNEVIRIDLQMSKAFDLKTDLDRIARADGQKDARKD